MVHDVSQRKKTSFMSLKSNTEQCFDSTLYRTIYCCIEGMYRYVYTLYCCKSIFQKFLINFLKAFQVILKTPNNTSSSCGKIEAGVLGDAISWATPLLHGPYYEPLSWFMEKILVRNF